MGVCSKIYTGGHRETFADLNKQTKLDSLDIDSVRLKVLARGSEARFALVRQNRYKHETEDESELYLTFLGVTS